MNALASLRTALRALTKNKLRSMLAMLGIVIAVSAVVATVAIGQGAQAKVAQQMESLGSNLLMVLPGSMAKGGVATGTGAQQSLTRDDATAIEREVSDSVSAVSPVSRTSGQVLYGGQNWFTSIQGVSPSYLDIRNAALAEGQSFTREQDAAAAKVAIIGKTVADKLFPNGAQIVGEQIRVKQEPVTVIGVLAPKGQSAYGQDQDDVILMPWTTVVRRLIGSQSDTVGQIMVLARSASQVDQAQSDVTALLSQRHHVQNGATPDFDIRNLAEMQDAAKQSTQTVLVLVTDLYEGGDPKKMIQRAAALVQSGVNVVCLLALNDKGAPAYHGEHAEELAALGIPSFACTPELFPDLMSAALQRRDLARWAARQQIATARPVR